jgi:hypothetical protein
MTVIAWSKTKGLAVDSQGSQGDVCRDVVKYCVLSHGVLAGTGKLHEIQQIFNQVENNLPISEFPHTTVVYMEADPKGKDSKFFVVTNGTWEDSLQLQDGEWRAIGSGMPYAHVALGMGKTPKEAVQLACRLDSTCGGKVVVFNAKGKIV